jgi:hypothetical protein
MWKSRARNVTKDCPRAATGQVRRYKCVLSLGRLEHVSLSTRRHSTTQLAQSARPLAIVVNNNLSMCSPKTKMHSQDSKASASFVLKNLDTSLFASEKQEAREMPLPGFRKRDTWSDNFRNWELGHTATRTTKLPHGDRQKLSEQLSIETSSKFTCLNE